MFFKRIVLAWKGRKALQKICKKNKIKGEHLVILMPHENYELNREMVYYLDEYLKKRFFDKAFLITFDEWVINTVKTTCKTDVSVIKTDEATIDLILNYYCFELISHNLKIVSIDKPKAASIRVFCDRLKLSSEDIVRNCIVK